VSAHNKNKRMSLTAHLLREATLLEYVIAQVGQLRLLVTVTQLNYSTSFVKYSPWAIALASLQHQMEGQCQLLSSMATHVSRDTGGVLLTSREAYETYCALREVKNERTPYPPEVPPL
jgi:hypothetical protein